MLWQRLILGPVMVAALIALLYFDDQLERLDVTGTIVQPLLGGAAHPPGGLVMLAVFVVLIALGSRELAMLFRAKGVAVDRWTLGLAGLAGLASLYAMPEALDGAAAVAAHGSVLAGVLLLALVRHSWGGRTQGVMAASGATLLALVYMGTLPGFYLLMRHEHAVWVVAGAIGVIKACDVGAYFTGKAIGRHKLIPWLSPAKTWEGLAGGLALAVVVAVVLTALGNHFELAGRWSGVGEARAFEPMRYSLAWAAVAGVLLGLAGHAGDLAASLFKRDAGVKDSGHSIPGFGGVLDVVDSPLMAAPVAYWLMRVMVV